MKAPFSEKQYLSAFKRLGSKISEDQRRMLTAHAGARGLLLNVEQLAIAARHGDSSFTYSQYGRLGHLVARTIDSRHRQYIWTRVLAADSRNPDSNIVQWRMHAEVERAVKALKWDRPRKRHYDGRSRPLHVLIAAKDDLQLLKDLSQEGGETSWPAPKIARMGDRVGFFRSGVAIVATGVITKAPWKGSGFGKSEYRWRVKVGGIRILTKPVRLTTLRGRFGGWSWLKYPRGTTTVPEGVAEPLRDILIGRRRARNNAGAALPEEAETQEAGYEGAVRRVRINAYERDARARKRCIDHYGYTCVICGFDFESEYGVEGNGIIHVHHVVPLSEVGRRYRVHAIKDLRPVCPNCHAMIHSRKKAYRPEEVRAMLRRGRSKK
jgi:hypothetical protein